MRYLQPSDHHPVRIGKVDWIFEKEELDFKDIILTKLQKELYQH